MFALCKQKAPMRYCQACKTLEPVGVRTPNKITLTANRLHHDTFLRFSVLQRYPRRKPLLRDPYLTAVLRVLCFPGSKIAPPIRRKSQKCVIWSRFSCHKSAERVSESASYENHLLPENRHLQEPPPTRTTPPKKRLLCITPTLSHATLLRLYL